MNPLPKFPLGEVHLRVRVRAGRGFTLVELLVCIAIIGIMAALLLPLLGKLKARAEGTACAGNLRQIGTGFYAYAADHDNTFPRTYYNGDWGPLTGGVWLQVLRGDVGGERYLDPKVFKCPSVRGTAVSYGMTGLVLWSPAPNHRTDDVPKFFTFNLRRSSEWPLVMDADNVAVYSLDNPKKEANADSRYAARHSDWANVLMADGHLEKLQYGNTKWKQGNINDGSWY